MESELDKELAALRDAKSQAEIDQRKAADDAMVLVAEFSRKMAAQRIPTLPVYMADVAVTPGQKKSFMQRERPRVWHTTYRTVAEGWPVGHLDSDSSAPPRHLNPPVVTADARLILATWGTCLPAPSHGTNYNKGPDYGVPALHTCQPDPGMMPTGRNGDRFAYLYVNSETELRGPAAPNYVVNARSLAEAMQHYLG